MNLTDTARTLFENLTLDEERALYGITCATVKGEYLGWYSEGLTLVRCRIEGTQPLCYCKDLTLIDCEMVGGDLSFENSTVNATIKGHVDGTGCEIVTRN